MRWCFRTRCVALCWLALVLWVTRVGAEASDYITAATMVVFSGGQDSAAVVTQRAAFAAGLSKSGNERLGSTQLKHWYMEADDGEQFPSAADQASMTTVIGDALNAVGTQVVVSFGQPAALVRTPAVRDSSLAPLRFARHQP